jgi:hypothetical protein
VVQNAGFVAHHATPHAAAKGDRPIDHSIAVKI